MHHDNTWKRAALLNIVGFTLWLHSPFHLVLTRVEYFWKLSSSSGRFETLVLFIANVVSSWFQFPFMLFAFYSHSSIYEIPLKPFRNFFFLFLFIQALLTHLTTYLLHQRSHTLILSCVSTFMNPEVGNKIKNERKFSLPSLRRPRRLLRSKKLLWLLLIRLNWTWRRKTEQQTTQTKVSLFIFSFITRF